MTESVNNGGYVIQHPSKHIPIDQRSFEMWAVHPKDLKELGFTNRREFFKAHLEAAVSQKTHT